MQRELHGRNGSLVGRWPITSGVSGLTNSAGSLRTSGRRAHVIAPRRVVNTFWTCLADMVLGRPPARPLRLTCIANSEARSSTANSRSRSPASGQRRRAACVSTKRRTGQAGQVRPGRTPAPQAACLGQVIVAEFTEAEPGDGPAPLQGPAPGLAGPEVRALLDLGQQPAQPGRRFQGVAAQRLAEHPPLAAAPCDELAATLVDVTWVPQTVRCVCWPSSSARTIRRSATSPEPSKILGVTTCCGSIEEIHLDEFKGPSCPR